MAYFVKPELKRQAYQKTGGNCAFCGDTLADKYTVSHIVNPAQFKVLMIKHKQNKGSEIPVYLEHLDPYDSMHIDNILACCIPCNFQKKELSVEAYRDKIMSTVGVLDRNDKNYKLAKRFGLVQETDKDSITFYFEQIDVYNKKRKEAV